MKLLEQQILGQVLDQWGFVLRILVAGILGSCIGFERKNRNKMAGVRTHAIVALGAALMMVVSKYGFSDIANYDASRVAAQIVSGVGFLGAGIIFVRNSSSVSGLTTAAGIWATAGVGMCMGSGLYFVAVVSAIMIVVMQVIFHKVHFLSSEAYGVTVKLVLKNTDNAVREIEDFILKEKIEIRQSKINKTDKEKTKLEMELLFPAGYNNTYFINRLAEKEIVISVSG